MVKNYIQGVPKNIEFQIEVTYSRDNWPTKLVLIFLEAEACSYLDT